MSTTPNAAGNFLANPAPFLSNYAAVASPWGTFVKPGGRIAAYVRSTGAQDGEDHFAASGLLVATINEGLKRCRSGQNDIVLVLPGHTETYSTTGAVWANLVAGAQVIGCGQPGATNNPNITLSHVGASIALNVANVTIAGLNINSATAAVTSAIVVTAAGCTIANNFLSFTGALAANAPVTVTSSANCSIVGNYIAATTTLTLVNVTGAGSTDLVVVGNFFRQSNAAGTSANYVAIANTSGISGVVGYNAGKTAASLTTPGTGFSVDGANIRINVINVENYCTDGDVGTAAVIATGGNGGLMSELYTVAVSSATPTEITGGRVGNLLVQVGSAIWLGPSTMSVSFHPVSGAQQVTDGVEVSAPQALQLPVTSPDEIYVVIATANPAATDT